MVQFVRATVMDVGGWTDYFHNLDSSASPNSVLPNSAVSNKDPTYNSNSGFVHPVSPVHPPAQIPEGPKNKNDKLQGSKKKVQTIYPRAGDTNLCDVPWTLLDRTFPLPYGYEDLTDYGLPGIVLSPEGKLVLLEPPISKNASEARSFVGIQGISATFYGEPICATIVDCGFAGNGSIYAYVYNVGRNETFGPFELSEVCSNPGVFFGCIDTVFALPSQNVGSFGGVGGSPVVLGEIGDELEVVYISSILDTTAGGNVVNVSFDSPVYLTCNQTRHWNFTFVSRLLLQEKLETNRLKLVKLLSQLERLNGDLFGAEQFIGKCEYVGRATDLSTISLQSFNFLDCLDGRKEDAAFFLDFLTQVEKDANLTPSFYF